MSGTITCCICGEDLDASLPGWMQCDSGWVCGGCNDATQEGSAVYVGESDGYELNPPSMDAWQRFGDIRGHN